MKDKIDITMILNVAIQTLCYIVIGLLFIGSIILYPKNTAFTFTIFGFTAILLYNLANYNGSKKFLIRGFFLY